MARKKKGKLKPKDGLYDVPVPANPSPREAKVGDKLRITGPSNFGESIYHPYGVARPVIRAKSRGNPYKIAFEDGDHLGLWYPLSSLEHEDGTPVAAPGPKEEDAPSQGIPISPVLLSQAQAQAHRGLLPNPFATDPGVWMGIDQVELPLQTFVGMNSASPTPLQRLEKEIGERGLEDWAHEHLDQIDLLDSSDWGLLYSARNAIRIGMNFNIPEDAFRFVVVRGNIGQTHWLWVPPLCKTAEQAVAWTFGMLPGEYAPISES